MIRRSNRNAFLAMAQGYNTADEDPNPLETVANLSDVMLVLAVALMIVIVMRANVDFSSLSLSEADLEPIEAQELSEVLDADDSQGEGDYTEVGRVYMNPEGDLFILGN